MGASKLAAFDRQRIAPNRDAALGEGEAERAQHVPASKDQALSARAKVC